MRYATSSGSVHSTTGNRRASKLELTIQLVCDLTLRCCRRHRRRATRIQINVIFASKSWWLAVLLWSSVFTWRICSLSSSSLRSYLIDCITSTGRHQVETEPPTELGEKYDLRWLSFLALDSSDCATRRRRRPR